MKRSVYLAILLGLCFAKVSKTEAQPVNDNWANAIEIIIPDDNMAVGAFQGTIVSLSGATNQTGEYLINPTYPKTVWYKFRVPSHRSVRIKTLQPTEILNQNDAGFVVYESTIGVPSEADMAIFTPFLCFACYSENVCLEQGEYYVQLVAKNVLGNVYIELEVEYTYPVSTTFAADQIANKHNLGTVTFNNSFAFNWDCLSLESSAEFSNVIGPDSLLYNKSIWFKFDTDDDIDVFAFNLYKYWNNDTYAIRIYEGDIGLIDLLTAVPIYESLHNVIYTGNSALLTCLLDTNTTYTVQLLGHEDYTGDYTFRIYHLGEGQVTGAYPQEANWNPLNDFGTITPAPAPGSTSELFDYYSCEALLTNDSIQCGTANPADSMYYDPLEYDLTTWFTLSTTAESNATFRARIRRTPTCNSDYYNHSMRIRIWHQNTDNDCDNYVFPDDLFYDGQLDGNGQVILNCLPTGDFAIQLLGRSQLDGNPFDCTNSQFGSKVTLAATLSAVPPVQFGLTTIGDVDWINTGNGLLDNILYTADSARFSCTKTILPDTAICDNLVDRAIYRQVIIADADGDAVADSGMIVVSDYQHYNALKNHTIKSVFYKGDAADLALGQGITQWPDEITNLEPFDGCNMWAPLFQHYWSPISFVLYNTKKYCVTPGIYTLASVGDSTENGALSLPKFRFLKQPTTQFADFENPENMGDIIAQGLAVTSVPDYFSCLDNPDTVGGLAPCLDYTKQLYREFYLSEDCRITVNEVSPSGLSTMRLYQGRASDLGLDSVAIAPFHSTGCYSGHSSSLYSLPACATVSSGWYTVVSYGYGPNYDNNYDFHEDQVYTAYNSGLYNINETSTVTVTADTTELPGPFFNDPHKACVAPDTIKYVNLATVDYPTSSTSYTLCMERFKFVTDTPYVDVPIIGCADTERLSFYVFTTDDEYFATITGISNFYKELYPLDVRTDSLLLPTTLPLTTCDGFNNDLAICRLQPGTYTLVVYGTAAQNCNITFTPAIRVAPVDVSRFDFAAHAYDFDLIPGDNTYYGGKVGDVHPDNPNLPPSDDTFYCTTGAFQDDPGSMCWSAYYDGVYPDTLNNAYFNEPGSQNGLIERNLWYTFVAQGMGTATVKIQNLTGGGVPTFFVYRSDVDGNIPFDGLVSSGELDSTLADGLELIVINRSSSCYPYPEASLTFLPDICVEDTLKRRYYIVAEITEAINGKPNLQMDLQIKWNPILANPVDPLYDFYHMANVIGDGEIAPPYTGSPLEYDTFYSGGWGNMSCATGDTTDQAVFGACIPENKKSLWWKLTLDEPGFLYMGTEMDESYSYYQRNLLEQVEPGDSIISPLGVNGLLNLGQGDWATPTAGDPSYYWKRYCVDPGTYYYHVARCAAVDTSAIRAHAYFTPISGDRCVDAVGTTGPTYGSYPVSVPILCHSMGSDFGEDGSELSCLQGPAGYNSTWFQFSYTGPDLVDILFQLNLSQLYNYNGTQNVRYRLFYGDDCATMIEGLECSNNAFINNSVACISEAAGDFYVQVTYPQSASGNLGFTFTVSPNTNPDCNPFNPTLLVADFVSQMNCTGDSLIFTNYSTSGSSLTYHWDFGWNGNTSTETNPIFAYPADGPYDVTVSVINPLLGDTASITYEVNFDTSGSPLELGSDQTICLGETATIGGFISQATYDWSTGENTSEILVSSQGIYWVDLSLNGCSYTDTVAVEVIDLNFTLGNDVQICAGDTLLLEFAINQQVNYLWSNGPDSTSTSIDEAGTYWLEISTGNCISSDTINVAVLDLSFDLGNDTTICAGTGFDLVPVVAAGSSFAWSDGSNGPEIFVNQAESIGLTISMDGCQASDTLEIFQLDLALNLGPDSIICLGDTILLIPQTNATVNYLWENGSTAPTQSVFETAWYILTVDSAACFATDSVYVETLDLNFDLGSDTTICAGSTLDVNPAVAANVTYFWSTGSTASQITVSDPDLYTLQIDSLHCSASQSINVDVLDLSFSLGNDTTICDGSSISFVPQFPNQVNFLWNDGSTSTVFITDTAGTYSLAIDTMGCSSTAYIDVDIFYVNAGVPPAVTLCLNDTMTISITGADSLTWTGNTSDITMLDNLNHLFHSAVSGQFAWTAFENGCIQTGDMVFDVIQPYIPDPIYTDHYCTNEGQISLPEIPFTTGEFSFTNNLSTLEIADFGPGSFEMIYQYTDTNSCAYSITLPFSISDTTTVAFPDPFPEICVDSNPVDLQNFINISGGTFSVNYLPSADTLFEITDFNPDLIPQNATLPDNFQVGYTYTNADFCTSYTSQQITVHPLPEPAFALDATCVFDTITLVNNSSVAGSEIATWFWEFGQPGTSDEFLPENIAFQTSGNFPITLTATSEIGCQAAFSDTITIYTLPEISFESYGPFCLNEGTIELPIATPVGGDFSMNETPVAILNSYNLGAGPHTLNYAYTDNLGCANNADLSLTVNDTTTIAVSLPETRCHNGGTTALAVYASHTPATFNFSYDGGLTDTTSGTFDPELISVFTGNPLPIDFVYTHTNAANCTSTTTDEITVHPKPLISISVEDDCLNEDLAIENLSTVTGSDMEEYAWVFENWGNSDQTVPAGISYNIDGTYEAILTATSSIGCANSDTATFQIFPLPILQADNYGPFCLNIGEIELPVVTPAAGIFLLENTPVMTLNTFNLGAGDALLTYTYTDTNTCYNELAILFNVNDTTTISFAEPLPEICFNAEPVDLTSYPSHDFGFFQYTYDLNGTDTIVSDAFDPALISGDPEMVHGHWIDYTYTNADGCISRITDILEIHPLPVIDFGVNDACVFDDLVFSNTSYVVGSGIQSYQWSIENLGISTQQLPPNIVYTESGMYAIELQVTSNIGCASLATDTVEIFALPQPVSEPYGPFCLNDGIVNFPETTPPGGQFLVNDTPIAAVNTYDFESGLNEVMYFYTDLNGCSNSIQIPFQINDTTQISFTDPFPEICIDADPVDIQPWLSEPDGNILVAYNLLDFTETNFFEPTEMSTFAGMPLDVPVKFSFTNTSGCTSTVLQFQRVHPLPVISLNVPDICQNLPLMAVNNSFVNGSDISVSAWDIEGTGTFDTFELPELWFESATTINYSLYLESSIGCTRLLNSNFDVHPVPQSNYSAAGQCDNVPVEFTASSAIESGTIESYIWWMDGIANPGQEVFSFLFADFGMYATGLSSLSEFGCRDTVFQVLQIHPAPLGEIVITDHCFNETVQISSNVSIPAGEIALNVLSSGSEFTHTDIAQFQHTFTTAGSHLIIQHLFSDIGCETFNTVYVEVYPLPEVAFILSDSTICLGENITFADASEVAAPQSIDFTMWSFDPGVAFMDSSGEFTSNISGGVSLTLTAVTDSGCTATLDSALVLTVWPLPVSQFEINPTDPNIANPEIVIKDQSRGDVVSWYYDFGDESTSSEPAPVHLFQETGEYLVGQTVTNIFGCTDSTFRKVEVGGFLVYIPNAFTPNQDGINDLFRPSIFGEEILTYSFRILNRWGNEVFYTADPNAGWNGSENGGDYYSKSEVYTYHIIVGGKLDEIEEFTGMVVLIR